MTENSKKGLREKFARQKLQLEQECQQLLFEQRKLQNKMRLSKEEMIAKFKNEIDKRKEKMTTIDFKLEQLEMLEIGSELVEGEVEAFVEVSEGTCWSQLMKEKAIVIEDDIVIRIDE